MFVTATRIVCEDCFIKYTITINISYNVIVFYGKCSNILVIHCKWTPEGFVAGKVPRVKLKRICPPWE